MLPWLTLIYVDATTSQTYKSRMYFDFAGLECGHDLRAAAKPWPHLKRKQPGGAVNPADLVCSSAEARYGQFIWAPIFRPWPMRRRFIGYRFFGHKRARVSDSCRWKCSPQHWPGFIFFGLGFGSFSLKAKWTWSISSSEKLPLSALDWTTGEAKVSRLSCIYH